MTNEELDEARVDEAYRQAKECPGQNFALIVARLAREGWTPPVAVDPDIAEAKRIAENWDEIDELVYAGIKRGRALAAAEAKPGVVWVKNHGLSTPIGAGILTINECGDFNITYGCRLSSLEEDVTHYAVITPPEGK